MSHNPTFRTYSAECKPSDIESNIAEEVSHICYQEGGHLIPIRWNENKIFNSYDEAREYLITTDSGWYDNRAVLYLDYSDVEGFVTSKKLLSLREKIRKLREQDRKLHSTNYYENRKSKFFGCKKCESKIAIAYMSKNNCPVCGELTIPPSVKIKIEEIKNKISEINSEINSVEKELMSKLRSKASKRWLVYYDYHT